MINKLICGVCISFFNGIKLTNDCVHLNTILRVFVCFFSLSLGSLLIHFCFPWNNFSNYGFTSLLCSFANAIFLLLLLKASRISFEIRFYVTRSLAVCFLSMHTKFIMSVRFKRMMMRMKSDACAHSLIAWFVLSHTPNRQSCTQIFKCRQTIDHHH